MAVLMAARRDASLYRSPGYSHKHHVVVDGGMACCRGRMRAAEGRAPVDETTAEPAAGVPDYMRCQRPGCRARWPR